jgi:hypothetical protein
MNTEEFHTTMLQPSPSSHPLTSTQKSTIRTLIPSSSAPSSSAPSSQTLNALNPTSASSLSSHHKPIQGKIPTALLLTCKQVFDETRLLPWERNTFTFTNWFWSGVYAARQFARGLRPWQRAAVRWVGVEVLARDLRAHGMREMGGGIGVL